MRMSAVVPFGLMSPSQAGRMRAAMSPGAMAGVPVRDQEKRKADADAGRDEAKESVFESEVEAFA
ncbi:MAG: hypothetical protein EBZ29_02905 [Synechococcaceae bacterium WB9_4xC_028]|nr:hypothetical protein [Synechococcaceae bacterium WB9_4xC_028]